MTADSAEALQESLRVTVITAFTDLGTARNRVPSRIGPLDCAFFGHFLRSNDIRSVLSSYVRKTRNARASNIACAVAIARRGLIVPTTSNYPGIADPRRLSCAL